MFHLRPFLKNYDAWYIVVYKGHYNQWNSSSVWNCKGATVLSLIYEAAGRTRRNFGSALKKVNLV